MPFGRRSNDLDAIGWSEYVALSVCADSIDVGLRGVEPTHGIDSPVSLQSRGHCRAFTLCDLCGKTIELVDGFER